MIELGELEKHRQEFEKRDVRVVVVSLEGMEDTKATQADFPHLTIVSDEPRRLIDAVEVLHPKSSPTGGDTAAPTTLLIDGGGVVRWAYRPDRVLRRLSVTELLAAVDAELR